MSFEDRDNDGIDDGVEAGITGQALERTTGIIIIAVLIVLSVSLALALFDAIADNDDLQSICAPNARIGNL